MPVATLGPARFDRNGEPLSGRRIEALKHRVFSVEGFATYRYDCGWMHRPNPDDVMEVYRRSAANSRQDPRLPVYPKQALSGVFRKNHLIALLQLCALGRVKVPDGAAWDDLRETLEYGVWMEVFEYSDVEANLDAFIGLMASDNFDAAHAMADDEFTVMNCLSHAMRLGTPPPGQDLWAYAVDRVEKTVALRLTAKDIKELWAYAQTTNPEHLSFLGPFSRFMNDSSTFRVKPGFYGTLAARTNHALQGVRLAISVFHLSSAELDLCQDGGVGGVKFYYIYVTGACF